MPSIVDFVNKHQRKLTVLAAFGLVAIAAAYYFGMGVVIDETTGKPIEGVFVVGRWRARQITPIESSSVCFKVDSTQSDANGRFMLWPVSWNFDPRLWSRERQSMVYKKGYRLSETNPTGSSTVLMTPDESGIDQRVASISIAATDMVCGSRDELKRYILPVYRAMFDEVKDIAQRAGDLRYLNRLNWLIETINR